MVLVQQLLEVRHHGVARALDVHGVQPRQVLPVLEHAGERGEARGPVGEHLRYQVVIAPVQVHGIDHFLVVRDGQVHAIILDPEAADGVGVLLHEARAVVGPHRVVTALEALAAHQVEMVAFQPEVTPGHLHAGVGQGAEMRTKRLPVLDRLDRTGHVDRREPVVRGMVQQGSGIAVATDHVQGGVPLHVLHVRALQLFHQGGGKRGDRGAPDLQAHGIHHIGRGVVVRRQEGGEGLALVQPVRAATEDEPFAVVLCPSEGLHTRHAGQRHFLQVHGAPTQGLGVHVSVDQQGRGEQDR